MFGNHFSFEELTKTDTGLYNIPVDSSHLQNLSCLWNTLNYIREKLGHPIIVNSAFRSPEVNKAVGGAKKSLHMQGRAADIYCHPFFMDELYDILLSEKDNLSELVKYSNFYHIAL